MGGRGAFPPKFPQPPTRRSFDAARSWRGRRSTSATLRPTLMCLPDLIAAGEKSNHRGAAPARWRRDRRDPLVQRASSAASPTARSRCCKPSPSRPSSPSPAAATFRALRERTEALTRSVAELQALEEVLRAVNSSLDLDTVLATIISRAVRLSQAPMKARSTNSTQPSKSSCPSPPIGMTEERVARLRDRRIRIGETRSAQRRGLRAPLHIARRAAGTGRSPTRGTGARASTPCSPCRCCARTR